MALDRRGIATMLKDFLKADTSVLYGRSKLMQLIEDKSANFAKSKVSNNNPNALFLWCTTNNTTEGRMQNIDYSYLVNVRIESLRIDPDSASNIIDDTLERINKLINDEAFDGTNFSSYYTDANAQIIDVVPISSDFEYPEATDNRHMVFEIENAIEVIVNKWQ